MSSRRSSPKKRPPGGSPAGWLQECLACGVLVVGARDRIVACTAEAAAHLGLKRGAIEKCLDSIRCPSPLPELIGAAAKSGRDRHEPGD